MHKNGNGKAKQSILNQPLSELHKSILATVYENHCRASFIQVRDHYYGDGLSEVEQARAQAAIYRAKRSLIRRGLVESVPNVFTLTGKGWDVADKFAQPSPPAPVIANDQDLDRMIEEMTRVRTHRHAHRANGGHRIRKPLVDIWTGRNIEGTYE